jgi:WD40 repeat protein
MWDWNMQKVIRTIAVGLNIPTSLPLSQRNFMLSFNPHDRTGDSFLLTGPEKTFKYLRKDVEYNLTIDHTQINEMDPSKKISSNFAAHAWSKETGHILICTDEGEMIVCENSGQYKAYILDSPKTGSAIEAVISLDNGFLIAVGSDFYIYRTSNVDDRAPLKIHGEKCKLEIKNEQKHLQTQNVVQCMAINSKENELYCITTNGQMISGTLNCRSKEVLPYSVCFDYVQGQFHKSEITGLDVCIRKQLIVTCAKDRQVCVWDYHNRQLEIQQTFSDECNAVAFHPSGLHIVVAFPDKIEIHNVLSKSLDKAKSITCKGCTEIQFSHGGHLFACVALQQALYVYNFYTLDCPSYMQFGGHIQKVKCIDWKENDLGFTTCCQGGQINFYDLYNYQNQNPGGRNMEKDQGDKTVKFSCVRNIPGKHYDVLAVGMHQDNKRGYYHTGDGFISNDGIKVNLSQIVITPTAKSVIGGVGEQDRPGSLQIFLRPENKDLEKINEVQAHSKAVEKLKLSSDTLNLFSVGQDGMLCIFDVRDRDPRAAKKAQPALAFSEEILTQ